MNPDMQQDFMLNGFWPMFGFFLVIGLLVGIGFYFVAGRLGKNKVLWLVLSVIPFVNYVFWTYAMFAIVIGVLDRLNALRARPTSAS
jgi:hypothetical protein